jgi:hypothetical protein
MAIFRGFDSHSPPPLRPTSMRMLILRAHPAGLPKLCRTGALMDENKQPQQHKPDLPRREQGSAPQVPDRSSGQGSQSALERLRVVERRKASAKPLDERPSAQF